MGTKLINGEKRGKKILLVEGEAVLSKTLKDYLEDYGFEVVACEDGNSAKSEISLQSYDLVISDVNVPGGSGGIEIIEHARSTSKNKKTPFILMTSYSKKAIQSDCDALGVEVILSKPFTSEEMIAAVYGYFNLSKSPELINSKPEFTDDEFSKIAIDNFVSGEDLKYDIFVKMSEKKYIKIANKGDILEMERVQSYRKKGLCYLYLKKDDFRKYLGLNVSLLRKVSSSSLQRAKKLNFLKHTSEIILEQIVSEKINPESFSVAKDVLESSFDMILDTKDGMELAEIIKSGGDKNYAHQIAVSFYSILIAKEMGWTSMNTLFKVSTAGFLHDIGDREIPPDLLKKSRTELSMQDIKLLETHAERGAMILMNCPSIPSDVIQVVLQHHERCSGRGYPHHLRKTQICPLARLIAVADTFCELAFKDTGLPVLEALSRLNSFYADELDSDYIEALNRAFKDGGLFSVKKSA